MKIIHKKNYNKVKLTKAVTMNYELVICTILFKFNNVFITVSRFKHYGNTFSFVALLASFSCGHFSDNTFQRTKKLSILTLNKLISKFIIFLIYSKNTYIHIIFKNNSYNKKSLLSIFIKFHLLRGIYIHTISYIYNYKYNGCRLKKRKFK